MKINEVIITFRSHLETIINYCEVYSRVKKRFPLRLSIVLFALFVPTLALDATKILEAKVTIIFPNTLKSLFIIYSRLRQWRTA